MNDCTCNWEREDYGGGVAQMVLTEPDMYCPEHFPLNRQIREDAAAAGYTMKRVDMIHAYPWAEHGIAEWESLPEMGKEVWRTWAEAEQWGSFMMADGDDGSAGNGIPEEEQPDPFPPVFADGSRW